MCACNVFGLWRQFALHEASCRLADAPRNLLICRVILHKPCNLVSKAHLVTGCRLTSCAMQPRRQSLLGHGLSRYTTQAMQPCRQSLLGHGLSPHKLRHATSQAEPARSRAVASQAAPCNLAGRACSVTGCRPIKRQSPTASYVSELPTKQREFVFLHGL